ncbi:MAG: alkaline phosphatase family protein [Candidatus Omnitrophica bacterium]|nr:alkaline phosphatase family protein [Candidatus Omnitrophota bacterium]
MVTKIFVLFLILFLTLSSLSESFSAKDANRVIVLGFDGVDPTLLEKFMTQGALPHLAALRGKGTYLPLGTTLPPQSPVSWASFATGMNPGKTRIFDFLTRMPGSYYPDFAMVGEGKIVLLPHPLHRLLVSAFFGLFAFWVTSLLFIRRKKRLLLSVGTALLVFCASFFLLQWLPTEIPKPIFRRGGESFWKITSRHGIPTVVIQTPVTFPAEALPLNSRLLSGLGVPDVRKTYGTFSFYTSEEVHQEDTEMGGKVIPVVIQKGKIKTFVWGPKNFARKGSPPILPEIQFLVDPTEKNCTIQFQGKSYPLKESQWSPWVTFQFDFNPLLHVYGIGRFYLLSLSPFKLYLSPINFHPARIPFSFSISSPRRFSKDLVEEVGLFKTLGWAIDTWSLNENRMDEKAFLEDLFFTENKRKEIMFHELAKSDWKLFVGVFEGTDRVQHMFWRTLDPDHPAYDAAEAARDGDAILKVYQEMDRTVGEVVDRFVDAGTILFVLSDHGFHSFRRSVNLNTWLVQQGYMTLKGMEQVRDRNLEDLFGRGEFWPNVDWSKTEAYAIGLAGIYLNRVGREPEGILSPTEADAVRNRLREGLLALEDPTTGIHPLLQVYRREEVYSGPYVEETPDLVLGFQEGYRVSWQTALGGIPKEIFEDNLKKWSGDHCSYDPSITSGIFFCNRKLTRKNVHVMDIAPTLLEIFALPVPSEMDGSSFKPSLQ